MREHEDTNFAELEEDGLDIEPTIAKLSYFSSIWLSD